MTKEEIMTRCRKVAIKIDGNRIFGDPQHPYEFVPAFRTAQLAEKNVRAIASTVTRPEPTSTICEFYLVPASRIDGTPPVAKK